jgi:leucyl-tRNA synthetase
MQLNPAVQNAAPTVEQNRMLHKTIKAVTNDIEQMSFNTAIARMMEFTNFFFKEEVRPKEAMEKFVLLLSPFAPHLAEEIWQTLGDCPDFRVSENGTVPFSTRLGEKKILAYEPWPTFDEAMLKQDTIEMPVQVNGKLRGRIQAPAGADNAALESLARAEEKVAEQLTGKKVVKVIVVPGKMVNFVVNRGSHDQHHSRQNSHRLDRHGRNGFEHVRAFDARGLWRHGV